MIDKERIIQAMAEVGEQAKIVLQATFASELGVNKNPHVMTNTLKDSHIYEEINTSVDGFEFINILVNDYIKYIESGRKQGSLPPYEPILLWADDKGLPTDNETIEKIRWSIYWNGITARPLIDVGGGFWDLVMSQWDDWFKGIYDILYEELDKQFDNTFKN